MHIISIGLECFRNFKKKIELNFAPITLLTGPNDSGKSSTIKALLLLRDTIPRYISRPSSLTDFCYKERLIRIPIPRKLEFTNESKHSLGGLKNVINNNSSQNYTRILLPFLLPEIKDCPVANLEMEFSSISEENYLANAKIYYKDELLFSQEAVKSDDSFERYFYKINLGFILKNFEKGKIIRRRNQENEEFKRLQGPGTIDLFNTDTQGLSNSSIETIGTTEYGYICDFHEGKSLFKPHVSIPGKSPDEIEEEHISKDLLVLEKQVYQEIVDNDGFLTLDYKGYPNSVKELLYDRVSDVFNRTYLEKRTSILYETGSILSRLTVDPDKPIERKQLELDHFGTLIMEFYDRLLQFNFEEYSKALINTVYYPNPDVRFEHLINEQEGMLFRLLADYLKMKNQDKKYRQYALSVEPYRFILAALEVLGIGEDFEIKAISDYGFDISIVTKAGIVRLKDSGFGIKKLVSLILLIGSRSYNYAEFSIEDGDAVYRPNTIILEEPESNLHPLLQSKLADLILYAAMHFNTQFIIETHSEYLIRKFQYLTATEDSLKRGDIRIYYFHDKNKNHLPKKIEIEKDGMLTEDFGPGFFDEANNLAIELFNFRRSQKN